MEKKVCIGNDTLGFYLNIDNDFPGRGVLNEKFYICTDFIMLDC